MERRTAPGDSSTVVGALGPTNTGKTHRAIERMLQHESGMIGLPLRLLAREVYDRVSARLGQDAVALVTGEERRIPSSARYWICTVEAMPLERQVDFIAIDEVQLAGHIQRGHVFTDRVLHARGRKETWFLGSDTMRPLLSQFATGIVFESCTRFSQLRFAGEHSLRSVPPRSAIVAFSTDEVYALAERLRRLRGGVAVVLGALSPRTRNAQVAMFQAGEVQYLVATDAIGMGLNLDVNHVAFASMTKFDGREQRPLFPDELAQIAGRAGRHVQDGTFGTLRPLPQLPHAVVDAIEHHRFPAQRQLVYRNSQLDFSSLSALQQSLCAPPPHPALRRVEQADDYSVLQCLSAIEEVKTLCRDEATLRLLWDVCQVPNFGKQLPNHHAAMLLPVWKQLSERGQLDAELFEKQVARLDRPEGDIATLTARLEGMRTYCYLSHRGGWLEDEDRFRERTRTAEERLGDALHKQLVDRFVSREARPRRRRVSAAEKDAAPVAGPFAGLQALRGQLPDASDAEDEATFLSRVEGAGSADFLVDERGAIAFEGEVLGRLLKGKELRLPEIAIAEAELWTAGGRTRLLRRLTALARDVVNEASGGATHLQARFESPAARGLAYALEQGLGILPAREGHALLRELDVGDQAKFAALTLSRGVRTVHLRGAVAPGPLRLRHMLSGLSAPLPVMPTDLLGRRTDFRDLAHALSAGHIPLGSRTLRLDVLEAARDIWSRSGAPGLSAMLASLALKTDAEQALVSALGATLSSHNGDKSVPSRPGQRRRRRPRRRRDKRSHAGQE